MLLSISRPVPVLLLKEVSLTVRRVENDGRRSR